MLVCLITILIMAIVIYYLWGQKNKSSFAFGNADLSYSNPGLMQEGKYYACVRDECDGETHDYTCARNCRIKAFRTTHGQSMSVAERMCEGIQNEQDKYSCLTNALSNFKTSYRQYTP